MKQKTDRKKIGIVAAAVVVALATVIIIAAVCRKGNESYRSIKIVELTGAVNIDRDGVGAMNAAENMNLVSGDRVTTGKDAYVVLRLDTDKYVMLGEAGAMKVVAEGGESNTRTAIHLEQGSVLNEIQNPLGNGSSFEVVTPNATMSVRGTVFEVQKEAGEGNISVLVYDGSVAVGLDGKEPALYGAGEYTMFTGGASPAVVVERGTVSDEVLDERVRERLQQMEEQGRKLNVGSADLSRDASEPTESPAVTAKPEPTAAPAATPAPTEKPAVTAAPEPTAAPAVTPTPTEKPAVTAKPGPTAAPAATPAPTEKPAVTKAPVVVVPEETEIPVNEPEEEEEDEPEPEPTVEPTPAPTAEPTAKPTPAPTAEPTAKPTPAPTAEPTAKPTPAPTAEPTAKPTPVPTAEPTATPAPTTEPTPAPSDPPDEKETCTLTYVIPYIAVGYEKDGKLTADLNDTEPMTYSSGEVKKGEVAFEVGAPSCYSAPGNNGFEEQLGFFGWCTEDGIMSWWNGNRISKDTVLYSVWTDSKGRIYKPYIYEDPQSGKRICNSVIEKTEVIIKPGTAGD